MVTDDRVVIDATNFDAPVLSLNNIVITPKVPKVASYSVWSLTIALMPMPLQKNCYIRMTFGNDLDYDEVLM